MICNKKTSLLIGLFLSVLASFSQEKDAELKEKYQLPVSIYNSSLSQSGIFFNQYESGRHLGLDNFRFLVINRRDFENGFMTVPFQNLKNVSTDHFFETYQNIYQEAKLKSSFFKLHDFRLFPFKKFHAHLVTGN